MSWLARSIANTLLIDDNDDPHPTSSNHDHSQFQQTQGSEIEDEDRTESLTRQLRGVAFFLAPPPPTHSDPSVPDSYVSGDDAHHASNSASDDSRFGGGYGISDSSDQIQNVGVTEEALAFARNISHHPETWLDFPLSEEEDDDDFEMSDTQWNHVSLVERLAPRLSALRIELCPMHMSESYFWKVYFVLLHPRLKKHHAYLLSTPQIVAARSMWIKELQARTKPQLLSSHTCLASCHESNDVDEEAFSIASSEFSSSANRTTHALEPTVTEKYPFTTGDQAVNQEAEEEDVDDDDWVNENLELNGYVGPIGTHEDISFSDLESDDDDCTMPIRSNNIM